MTKRLPGWEMRLAALWPAAAVALCLLVEMNATARRSHTWRNEESLWEDAVVKSRYNGRAWMNLGVAQMGAGKYAAAEYSFERAKLYAPTYALVEVNLGVLTNALGRKQEAAWHYGQAVKLEPNNPTVMEYVRAWKDGR